MTMRSLKKIFLTLTALKINMDFPKRNKSVKNSRYQNVKIYEDTIKYFRNFSRENNSPKSIRYDINIELKEIENGDHSPIIEVRNEDSLDMAMRYRSEEVLVLNMASKWKPGGGVCMGSTAQEEVIFRRTNAFMTHPKMWYPLKDSENIYSPEVHIVRDSSCDFLSKKDRVTVSMLAVHAIQHPQVCHGSIQKYSRSDDYELMTKKIESIFKIGILQKKKILVLGALGCGAYENPVDEVLLIFEKALQKYGKYFDKIGFAVLANNTTGMENYQKFKKKLS